MIGNVFQESMREVIVYSEGEVIWAYDLSIGGLYKLDRFTCAVENVLSPRQVFEKERFKPVAVAVWKDRVFIVPSELNRNWVIYDKRTGKRQYKHIINDYWKITGFYIIGGIGFLEPASTKDPIIMIDMDTMSSVYIVENWSNGITKGCKKEFLTWGGVKTDTGILFPLIGSNLVAEAVQSGAAIHSVDIPYGISSIDMYENEIWILPTEGDCLYITDRNGKVLTTVELNINGEPVSTSDFVRIVVAKQYVFLLPLQNRDIYVYDKNEKGIFLIRGGEKGLQNLLPAQQGLLPYWEYLIDENKVCFLPYKNRYLLIDLVTLEWEEKDIFLPSEIADHGLKYWIIWGLFSGQDKAIKEIDKKMLDLFLEFIKNVGYSCEIQKTDFGKTIWMGTSRRYGDIITM